MISQVTLEIRKNIDLVIETLSQVADEYGYFELVSLKATGLTRLEVMQAISFLNEATGYKQIYRDTTRLFGGFSIDDGWCWADARKYRLACEQAAAVAEVERLFQ